jgi:hypothetical protein
VSRFSNSFLSHCYSHFLVPVDDLIPRYRREGEIKRANHPSYLLSHSRGTKSHDWTGFVPVELETKITKGPFYYSLKKILPKWNSTPIDPRISYCLPRKSTQKGQHLKLPTSTHLRHPALNPMSLVSETSKCSMPIFLHAWYLEKKMNFKIHIWQSPNIGRRTINH